MQRVLINNKSLEKQRLFGLLDRFLNSGGENYGLVDLRNSLEIAKSSNSNETYFDLLNKISNNAFNIPGFVLERSLSGNGNDLQVIFLQSHRVFEASFSDFETNPTEISPALTTNMQDEDIKLTREEVESIRKIIFSQKAVKENLKSSAPVFDDTLTLDEDTYSLMMLSDPFSRSWALGLFSALVQIVLSGLALKDQSALSEGNSLWNIPFRVSTTVRIGQFFTVIMFIAYQKDLLSSIRCVQCLSYGRRWDKVVNIRPEERSVLKWTQRILFPNFLKFCQATLVTVISFILIAQSNGIINLLKDFSALVVLSDFDNSCFELASQKYLGKKMAFATQQVLEGVNLSIARLESENASHTSRMEESIVQKKMNFPRFPQILLLLLVTGGMLFVSFVVVKKQDDGTYFSQKFPDCPIGNRTYLIEKVGDGTCDGGFLNTRKCGLDGGDCRDFTAVYPHCDVLNVKNVGDGICNPELNVPNCGFDERDCCPYNHDPLLGNGKCNGGYFASGICGHDLDDCQNFTSKYATCDFETAAIRIQELDKRLNRSDSSKKIILGDGECDTGAYISPECGFEMGDCEECKVSNYKLLGDTICDGGRYNTEYCHWDFGDCLNENFLDCHVDTPKFIGDGVCDGDIFRVKGCQDDGGDCNKCDVLDKSLLSNSICNDDKEGYNSRDCSWDGRDCNRAKGMIAKQSSIADVDPESSFYADLVGIDVNELFRAMNAVDGNAATQTVFYALTKKENNPHWSVYLSHMYKIEAVMIYGVITEFVDLRDLLSGFKLEIFLFNELKYEFQSNPNKTTSDLRRIVYVEGDIIGNEVKISIPGKNKTLAIREVEVYGQMHLENLALRRDTDQVAPNNLYTSKTVVDGNLTFPGITIHLFIGNSWRVHLKDMSSIKQIRYYFSEMTERKKAGHFTTTISDGEKNVYSHQDMSSISDMVIILNITNEVIGNFVEISSELFPNHLVMTEVEVFGHSVMKNIAFGKNALQSSSFYNKQMYGPERALDGIIYNFDNVAHTLQENSPWWQVYLLDDYRIDKIIFYLRHMGYDHWVKMKGMRLQVLHDSNITYSKRFEDWSELRFSNVIKFDKETIIGNMIRIDIEGTVQLILGEVEVFGEKVQRDSP